MSKSLPLLMCALLVAAWDDRPATAQADPSADGESTEAVSAIDAAEAELRELICSRAANFSHPSQEHAMQLVFRREYHDERFDAPIRLILEQSAANKQWDPSKIERALELLPFSKLDPEAQTELVFACFLRCGDSREDTSLSRDLQRYLSAHPDQTSKLVKEKMVSDGVSRKLFPLLQIVGKSTEEMLPMLLGACRSDDRALAESALAISDTLIRQLRRYREEQVMAEKAEKISVENLDPKLVTYAERIVARYDKNKNGTLTEDEWRSMLLSPAPADLDKNGFITAAEYATWMESRQKKKK